MHGWAWISQMTSTVIVNLTSELFLSEHKMVIGTNNNITRKPHRKEPTTKKHIFKLKQVLHSSTLLFF